MSQNNRELTARERRRVRKLVTSLCANYDAEYGCLPLDCGCYMFGVRNRGSALCRYFREAVLPNEPELQAVFQPAPLKSCKLCGGKFPAKGRQVYCPERCAQEARRRQTAARVRRHRQKQRV